MENHEINMKCIQSACEKGDSVKLKLYISYHKGDIKTVPCDHLGNSLLHLAAKGGNPECVSILLKKEVKIDVLNTQQDTPLHLAVKSNNEECVKLLLDHGANPGMNKDFKRNTPLHYAAKIGSSKIVQLLIESIAKNGSTNIEKEINARNSTGYTPLCIAAAEGSLDCVELLLNHYAEIDARDYPCGNTPLHLAARSGFVNCVRSLLEAGAEPCAVNLSLNTPLHYAAESGSVSTLQELMEFIPDERKGLILNTTNSDLKNPVHLAARAGSLSCLKLLAKRGSVMTSPDKHCNTPLHYAALEGSTNCIKYLINNSSSLLLKNKNKETPLSIILNRHDGEDIFTDILNDCVLHNSETDEVTIDLRVLWPDDTFSKVSITHELFECHRNKKKVLLHPVIKTLVHSEWQKVKLMFLATILLPVVLLALFITFTSLPPEDTLADIFRVIIILFNSSFTWVNIVRIKPQRSVLLLYLEYILLLVPFILTLVATAISSNKILNGFAMLALVLNLGRHLCVISYINRYMKLLLHVSWEVVKHLFVSGLVFIGFSLIIFVFNYDKVSGNFHNFWHEYSLMILAVLQVGIGTKNSTHYHNVYQYDIIFFLLFLLLLTIILLNMLVSVIVKCGTYHKENSELYEYSNKIKLLYNFHTKRSKNATYGCTTGKFIRIEEKNTPKTLRNEIFSIVTIMESKKRRQDDE